MNSNVVAQVGQDIADGLSGAAGAMSGPISSGLMAAIGVGVIILIGMVVWRVFKRTAK